MGIALVVQIYFLLVRIKIKHMEMAIIRRETAGTGSNQYNESETIVKYEVMDGAPAKGEYARKLPSHRMNSNYRENQERSLNNLGTWYRRLRVHFHVPCFLFGGVTLRYGNRDIHHD